MYYGPGHALMLACRFSAALGTVPAHTLSSQNVCKQSVFVKNYLAGRGCNMGFAHARLLKRTQALGIRHNCCCRHCSYKLPFSSSRAILVRCQRPDWAGAGQNLDEWGDTEDDDDHEYFENTFSSSGYEAAATALTLAAGAALLKLLWYLAIVCWAMVTTALQYSVVAIALLIVVVFLG
jgi:hypothetical protein